MIGTALGPYQVVAKLGEGGMGEVYRAHDTRLGRDVAIKVARENFDSRFEREARTVAALNHSNICTLHDVGANYLVMELVEGPTLEAVISDARRAAPDGRAGLPVDEAIRLARQIALALEAAHAAGVIHRDLKPANVKVRPDGVVKVLDFGLARALGTPGPTASGTSDAAALTVAASATQAGTILGTAAYMSPEQANGRPADARSDIWSFGCVLYEMLTGRQAFTGSTLAETLAAVLGTPVDWDALPPAVPPAVRAFLIRCLERDPKQRVHAIADVRLAIEGAFDVAGIGAPIEAARRRRTLPMAIAAVLIAAAAWTGGSYFAPPAAAPVVSRLQMMLPPDQEFYYNGRHVLAVSPTGTHVAYTAGLGLWLHALDSLEPMAVPGAELEARNPFFSPDGASIGYFAAGELRRVSITGGAPVTITQAVNPWGARWEADGHVYYGQGTDGIWRVPATGGPGERIIGIAEGEIAHGPQVLPGGRQVLFTLLPNGTGSWNRAQIVSQEIGSSGSDTRVVLVDGGRDARFLETGHLVYALSGRLLAAPFDPATPRLTGSAVPMIEDVFDAGTVTGATHFDISPSGTLAYVPLVGAALRLVWVDRSANEEMIPAPARPYRHARVSPDGTRIAVEIDEPGNTDIWVGDARTGSFNRLPASPDVESDPIWTPDGSRVVFSAIRGATGLFVQPGDGSGAATHLIDGSGGVRALSWAGDGRLVYEELAGAHIRLAPLDGSTAPEVMPVFDEPNYFNEILPAMSPDGRWLAYQSTESGTMEIYVRPFPALSSGRWQISAGGGWAPLWSRASGELELYYRTANRLMAVAIRTDPVFSASPPQQLFGLGDYALAGTRGIKYDVAPDGRFLLTKDERGGSGAYERIVVVQHWFEELKRTGR